MRVAPATLLACLAVSGMAAPALGRGPTVEEVREARWILEAFDLHREQERNSKRPDHEVDQEQFVTGAVALTEWRRLADHVRNKDLRQKARTDSAEALVTRFQKEAAAPDQRLVQRERALLGLYLIEIWRRNDDQAGWSVLAGALKGLYPNVELDRSPGPSQGKRAQAYAAWKKFLDG